MPGDAHRPSVWQGGLEESPAGPFKVRGVGIASVMHGMGYGPVVPDVGNAKVELTGGQLSRLLRGGGHGPGERHHLSPDRRRIL